MSHESCYSDTRYPVSLQLVSHLRVDGCLAHRAGRTRTVNSDYLYNNTMHAAFTASLGNFTPQ